jgi:uncharacterized protein (TIGR02466 family)
MRPQPDLAWHFPTPIFIYQLEGFENHRAPLVEYIMKLKSESPGLTISNQNGWHSKSDLHLSQHESIQWLIQNIGQVSRSCLVRLDKSHAKADILLNSCWANVSGFGAWNTPHHHYPNHWSGVYYVQVEESVKESDRTNKNGLIEFLNPTPLGMTYGQPSAVSYIPKDGLIMIFPGML